MIESLLDYFRSIPPWLAVFLLGGLPIAEIRVALPIAREVYQLPWFQSLFWSILGNILPPLLILLFLEGLHKFSIRHLPISAQFFDWLFERSRAKFIKKYEKYGALALIIFVGIPLPLTGAWTAAVAAFVFGIPIWRAFFYICLGVFLAAVIMSLIILGIF